jgi:hypothetical protein
MTATSLLHPMCIPHADTTARTVTGGPTSSGSTSSASIPLPATLDYDGLKKDIKELMVRITYIFSKALCIG